MGVSKTKICLGTSISPTNISKRGEYILFVMLIRYRLHLRMHIDGQIDMHSSAPRRINQSIDLQIGLMDQVACTQLVVYAKVHIKLVRASPTLTLKSCTASVHGLRDQSTAWIHEPAIQP